MYSVAGPECDLYVNLREQVSDVGGFFAHVGEHGPFLCQGVCVCVIFVCVLVMSGGSFGLGGFSWWIGKALLYRLFWMVVASVS